jgi:hypothetical protein
MNAFAISHPTEDRYLLVDDTDEDASQLLTVICDGDPRTRRGFGDDTPGYLRHHTYAYGGAE